MNRKNILVVVLLIFLISKVDAQLKPPKPPVRWYTKEYGVSDINDLTEEQLAAAFVKAKDKRNTGLTLIILGAGTAVGGIALLDGIEYGQSGEEVLGRLFFGLILEAGGTVMNAIGIPILISYSSRLLQIKNALNYTRQTNAYFNITPMIDYNKHTNTYSSGITFTLNF